MKLLVVGAGAWGTALAVQACQRHDVTLWARDAYLIQNMQQQRQNPRYLPGRALPEALQLSHADISLASKGVDMTVLAVPMASLRSVLQTLAPWQKQTPLAWLCKGFEAAQSATRGQGLLAHEVQAQVAPNMLAGVLSGPSFAQEVADMKPAALVAASEHASVRQALVEAFHGDNLRVYANDDVVGVEVGGAVKNVMAIATGLCDGLNLGLNARAALITRGLTEMTRLGMALGARAETFMGLSGLGDLVLTATGDLSRNRRVGLALAQGKTLAQAVEELGHVAEGVYSAPTALARAQALGVEMPLTEAVVAVLHGRLSPAQAVAQLMRRDARPEAPSGD